MSQCQELLDRIDDQSQHIARFLPAAFHIHSVDSHDWAQRKGADPELNRRAKFLAKGGIDAFLNGLAAEFGIVCVTDHMKARYACALSQASLSRSDVLVLPGMEVACEISPFPGSIHVLVILPPGSEPEKFERCFSGHAGFPVESSRDGKERFRLPALRPWIESIQKDLDGIVLLAHIDSDNGHRQIIRASCKETLVSFLFDSEGVQVEDERAIAEAYATQLAESGVQAVEILKPRDRRHYVSFTYGGRGKCTIPCVVRSDAHCFEECGRPEGKTYLKVPTRSFEAVKDALVFSDTRVRYHDEIPEPPSPWIVGMRVVSPDSTGLFADCAIAFSQNLNCIIGARGSGKTTLIEALRYAMGANRTNLPYVDADADVGFRNMALSVQKANLEGTLVQVLYQTEDNERFVLSATYDARNEVTTEVVDAAGAVRDVAPEALPIRFPARVYSWGEIEALGRRPELQRSLIDCLIEYLPADLERRSAIYRQLAENQKDVLAVCSRLGNKLSEQRGQLRRYAEYKKEFDLINTEEMAALFAELDGARERLDLLTDAGEAIKGVKDGLHLPSTAAADAVREGPQPPSVPGVDDLVRGLLTDRSPSVKQWWDADVAPILALADLSRGISAALLDAGWKLDERLAAIEALGATCRETAQAKEQELRERTQARPADEMLRGRREASEQRFRVAERLRAEYLVLWGEFDQLLKSRNAFTDQLDGLQRSISKRRGQSQDDLNVRLDALQNLGLRIAISYHAGHDRTEAVTYMRDTGFLSRDPFGHYKDRKLAERCCAMARPTQIACALMAGDADLLTEEGVKFDGEGMLSRSEAQQLVQYYRPFADEEAAGVTLVDELKLKRIMDLQEKRWDDSLRIMLDGVPVDRRSPGQRSSAMLPLVAIAEKVPLIIDQPEDNLDNLLVGNVMPRILADLKETRQIIVATHSPNIVVGGDAEQVVIVQGPGARQAEVAHTGSIDDPGVIESVIGIMEGGERAFAMRARRYSKHIGSR